MHVAKPRSLVSRKTKKTVGKEDRGFFAEAHTVAPSPSRDYYALQLYQKKFVWTRWKISYGPYTDPVQRVVRMEEFLRDTAMQNELTYIFGADVTNLISDLANEKWCLISMPTKVLQKIFSYISVPDILRLSQVCKRLLKECSRNELWKTICKKQWKILIHNDIEKAGLIGWKRVYLEKMKPKRYKTDPTHHHPKSNILRRNRICSVSNLDTPDSRNSTIKNFTLHKRVQELKKTDALRSTSEIFGKDFKVVSTSTGKSTERTFKVRCNSRNCESRPTSSGKLNMTSRSNIDRKYFQPPSHLYLNFSPLAENPKESAYKSKSPRTTKCKVTSIRMRSSTARSVQPTEVQSGRLRAAVSTPSTGKTPKAKL